MNPVSIKRHNVFLGASGSGKTELAINFAVKASSQRDKKISFFDMDQTKGLFRSRDFFDMMTGYGIDTVDTCDFQDAPIVPAGVTSKINSEDTICVFDVGGNTAGAVMIGQYTGRMKPEDTNYFYVINPCRPFTDTLEDLEQSMAGILNASGVDPSWIQIISNPNMGGMTDPALILAQHRRLEKLVARLDMKPVSVCASTGLARDIAGNVNVPVIPLQLYISRLY